MLVYAYEHKRFWEAGHDGIKLALYAALALMLAAEAAAQTTPSIAPSASPTPPPDAPPVKPTPPGPYPVSIIAEPSLMTHTVYRPTNLAPFKGAKRLGIVA